MATKKWFVLIGGEEMGPLGPRGLRKLVRTGEIVADTELRREDRSETMAAAHVRGLLPAEEHPDQGVAHGQQRAKIHGPFTALRTLGWSTAGTMFAFAALGVVGVFVAVWQLQFVQRFPTTPLLVEEGESALFGAGVFAVMALVAVGGVFMWWIWTARINLPHLINARIQNPPSWAIVAWLVPFLNLIKPYAVVSEIDRLSAEAEADGDATVDANHNLLVPWWITSLLGTAFALTYMLRTPDSIEALSFSAWLHLAAASCTIVSGILAGWIVLRVTNAQERAHAWHDEPVELRHEIRRGRSRKAAGAM